MYASSKSVPDFADSVFAQVRDVKAWIQEHETVTDDQATALDGWEHGVSNWQPAE